MPKNVDLLASVNQKYDNATSGLAADNAQAAIDEIAAAGGGGEANLGANVGTGNADLFRDKTGVTLNFKRLVQGPGIALTNGADAVTLTINLTDAVFPTYAVFDAKVVSASGTVDFSSGQKQEINATTYPIITLVPSVVGKPANYMLTILNSGSIASIGTIEWGNGTPPSWAGTTLLALYYDGSVFTGSALVNKS